MRSAAQGTVAPGGRSTVRALRGLDVIRLQVNLGGEDVGKAGAATRRWLKIVTRC